MGAAEQPSYNNRGHFFGAAAEAMRRILVDRARSKARVRHGGQLERVDLEHVNLATEDNDETLLAMNDALGRFLPSQTLAYFPGIPEKRWRVITFQLR